MNRKRISLYPITPMDILDLLSIFSLLGIGIIALPSSIITVKTSVELTNTFHFSLFLPIVV